MSEIYVHFEGSTKTIEEVERILYFRNSNNKDLGFFLDSIKDLQEHILNLESELLDDNDLIDIYDVHNEIDSLVASVTYERSIIKDGEKETYTKQEVLSLMQDMIVMIKDTKYNF